MKREDALSQGLERLSDALSVVAKMQSELWKQPIKDITATRLASCARRICDIDALVREEALRELSEIIGHLEKAYYSRTTVSAMTRQEAITSVQAVAQRSGRY